MLDEDVLVLTPEMLAGILVLASMFEFMDPEEPPVFPIPECREVKKNGFTLLQRLVNFTQGEATYSAWSTLLREMPLSRSKRHIWRCWG